MFEMATAGGAHYSCIILATKYTFPKNTLIEILCKGKLKKMK